MEHHDLDDCADVFSLCWIDTFPNFPVGYVDGGWGMWNPWSECTKTCGGGKTERRRECDSPSATHGVKHCQGHATQSRDCRERQCKSIGENCVVISVCCSDRNFWTILSILNSIPSNLTPTLILIFNLTYRSCGWNLGKLGILVSVFQDLWWGKK